MAEIVACLCQGRIIVLQPGQTRIELESPYASRLSNGAPAVARRFVDVSRGRRNDELCYAISSEGVSSVFTQVPGTGDERRLFSAEAEIRDLDFSFADEALACTVKSKSGTTAIGMLADDGRGMRTVTEGDVLDREPRWAPGGRGEIVYASAGVGRTKSGVWAGLGPSSLHRLRLADSTVEVLVSDAKYDYLGPVPVSASLIYALRRTHDPRPRKPTWARIAGGLLAPFSGPRARAQMTMADVPPGEGGRASSGSELVRITDKGMDVLASHVLAFDATVAGVLVYSTMSGVFRVSAEPRSAVEEIADLTPVDQVLICSSDAPGA